MCVQVVQQVLTFLYQLGGTGTTPAVSAYQDPVVHETDTMPPIIDEPFWIVAFPRMLFDSLMTCRKYKLMKKYFCR